MENNNSSILSQVFQDLRSKTTSIALVVFACQVTASCANNFPELTASESATATQAFPTAAPKPPVYLTPGDIIEIKFLYWPELDQEQEIRPDGKIALQMVGQIDVAGSTPEQLDQYLTEVYEDKIKDPVITTVVKSFGNRQVYVGGEVLDPGFIELRDSMTALEAIMSAGGFDNHSANASDVLVIRHVEGQRFAQLLDFDTPIDDPQSVPLLLAPRDIVFVPRTRIDQVNQWVDQYIAKVIPSNVLWITTSGNTTYGIGTR